MPQKGKIFYLHKGENRLHFIKGGAWFSEGIILMINKRVFVNPNICHGQACICGTRIPVNLIIKMPANGDALEE
jgi:NAD-dependent dihydropyrimidine dehydrogenase PreA subunit